MGPGDIGAVAVSAILSNFTAFAASAGAASVRTDLGVAASFAELLADELQPPAVLPPPQIPVPMPAQALYPWVPIPVFVPSTREDRSGKKRPPPRWDRRPGATPSPDGRVRP